MWYNNKIAYFSDNFYEINKKYCDKFGYDIIRDNTVRLKDYPPHWERYAMLHKLGMEYDYEYLMWIDSDAHFYYDSPALETFIEKHPQATFILSGDWTDDVKKDSIINSGVFIVKNNKYSQFVLKEIYSNKELQEKRDKTRIDQGLLRYMHRNNVYGFKSNSVIIPYLVMQHFTDIGHPPVSDKDYENYIVPKLSYYNLTKPYIKHYVTQTESTTKNIRYNKSMEYLNHINSR